MEHIGTLPEANDILSPTIIYTALRDIVSYGQKRRRMPLLSGNNNKRTISGIQTTLLRTLHSHRMFQDIGISYRIDSALRLLQNNVFIRRHMCFPCCHTKVHSECTTNFTTLFSLPTYGHSLECRQLTDCDQLWVHI